MRARKLAVVLAVLASAGCYSAKPICLGGTCPPPVDGGIDFSGFGTDAGMDGPLVIDMGVDAGPPPDLGPCTTVPAPRPVDLLFVVDDSPSMVEEQAALAAEIPHFVTALTTGDLNGDGFRDVTPVDDLHAGVITVNMGVGGIPNVPTCMRNPDFGDDGILLTVPRVGGAGCASSYPSFLTYVAPTDPDAGVAEATQLASDFTCLARTGTMGCGFEQQLDATLKAVLPSTSPVTFYAGTHGHADDPTTNGGFRRLGSVLAIVLITDEDDCSTDVVDLWNPVSATHTGDLNLRCIDYDSELYTTTRFSDALSTLSSDVVFLAITGVPEDLAVPLPGTHTINYMALFADTRMQNHVTISGGTATLDPACSSVGRGVAAPAIRISHVAEQLGDDALVQSICAADYTPAVDLLLSMIAPKVAMPGCVWP